MPKIYKPIKRSQFEKFLRFVGCTLKRTKGDHLIYDKPGLRRPVVITTDKEVPAFHVRTNLRTLNLSYSEFEEIMKEVRR